MTTRVEELYDSVAARFDEIAAASCYVGPAWLSGQLPSLPPVRRAVDFGCATGTLGKLLRRQYPEAHLTGVDFSQPMVDRARETRVYDEVVVHDLNQPVKWIGSGALDLVVALGFSEFLDRASNLVVEATRLLAPGGVLFVSFQQHVPESSASAPRVTSGGGVLHRAYTLEEVRSMVSAAGLAVERIDAMTGYVSRSGFAHPYLMVRATRGR